MESVYVLVFIAYAPKKEKAKIMGLFNFVLAVFSVVALVSVFALHGNSRKLFCGVAAAISSIVPNGFGCALGHCSSSCTSSTRLETPRSSGLLPKTVWSWDSKTALMVSKMGVASEIAAFFTWWCG
ncbi:hypothetical protein ACLB2K_010719 [Fragaria x ananassa]